MAGFDHSTRAEVIEVVLDGEGPQYIVKAQDQNGTQLRWKSEIPPAVGDVVRSSIRWTILG